jgi:hypothetical protein
MPPLANFLHHLILHGGPMLAGAVAAWLVACWPEKPPPFDPAGGGQVVRHGWIFRAFSLVCLVILGGPALVIVYGAAVTMDRDPALMREPVALLIIIPLLILGLSIYLTAEAFRVRIDVTPAGIIGRSPWRRRRAAIRWEDVTEVFYSHWFDWLTIKSRDGPTIRAHYFLRGFPWLARAVLLNVSPEVYERDAVILESLAARTRVDA